MNHFVIYTVYKHSKAIYIACGKFLSVEHANFCFDRWEKSLDWHYVIIEETNEYIWSTHKNKLDHAKNAEDFLLSRTG